ncbi:DEAD/DEAH box helicase [Bacillus marinisedimentorum]|uniref:DEAD/DEAH box helicase n=1 Tax=Bacillus marinisedimentorum TaxID=1821260 RepID=UPI0007E29967|nr:DEAD/DEAH box helicase [Bacillus marinisedimentorum]
MKFASLSLSGKQQLVPEVLAPENADLKQLSAIDELPLIPQNHHFIFSKILQLALAGKKLLLDELPFDLNTLHEHYENGYLAYDYGVKKRKGGPFCNRCGNKHPDLFASFKCARCMEVCTYCRHCIMSGRVSECTPLLSWTGPPLTYQMQKNPLIWDGELSSGQQTASDHVVEAVRNHSSLLVWAVCGAGKTEVLFKGIGQALKTGLKVCLAAPRTDVVLELAPRLKEVFPDTEIITLYGGSEDRTRQGRLVITTTHQLLRYDRSFDVIIIDEVDAFPYSLDSSLQYAADQAAKEEAARIYLTATPSKQLKRKVKKNQLPAVRIPARYHGQPLPLPEFKWCGQWKKHISKGKLPVRVEKWVNTRLEENIPAFLFVPDLETLQQTVNILKNFSHDIEGVHAADLNRKEKVEKFRRSEISLLVTTTILERGVTVAGLDAAVLGSEAAIFTESALVQIAGRVGRSAAQPRGNVTFFHFGATEAMQLAYNHINKMNKEARDSGLLK